MAKRFTDTDLWDKEWFMVLKPRTKCLVRFIFDKCDAAGVWSPNWTLANSFVGEKVSIKDLDTLKKHFEVLKSGKIFVCDFVHFQYGELTEKCPPHRKVIALLKTHGLFERVTKGYQYPTGRVQEEEEEEEEVKEEEKEGERLDARGKNETAPDAEPPPPVPLFKTYSYCRMPWPDEDFETEWVRWKRYKKEQHRFTYKGNDSEQQALIALHTKANGDKATAIAIINESIGNGYSGLFPLKNQDQHGKPQRAANSGASNAAAIIAPDRDYSKARL